jgi:hypothetical protein
MSFVATSLRISAGVLVWSVHFAVIYGFTALACARGTPQAVPWVIGVATLAAAAVCVLIAVKEFARRERFESWLAGSVASVALVAVVLEALPVFMVSACA